MHHYLTDYIFVHLDGLTLFQKEKLFDFFGLFSNAVNDAKYDVILRQSMWKIKCIFGSFKLYQFERLKINYRR